MTLAVDAPENPNKQTNVISLPACQPRLTQVQVAKELKAKPRVTIPECPSVLLLLLLMDRLSVFQCGAAVSCMTCSYRWTRGSPLSRSCWFSRAWCGGWRSRPCRCAGWRCPAMWRSRCSPITSSNVARCRASHSSPSLVSCCSSAARPYRGLDIEERCWRRRKCIYAYKGEIHCHRRVVLSVVGSAVRCPTDVMETATDKLDSVQWSFFS